MIELKRVLIEKLGFEEERWRDVKDLLSDVAVEEAPVLPNPPENISGDPSDDLVLVSAANAQIAVLVSGDRKHLLPLGEYLGVQILTPQALLADLNRDIEVRRSSY
jgi:predicted nucleic acid-binding protein